MRNASARAGLVILAGALFLFAAITICRPLMPVDETRYLSVAWEMWVQHHWILPTLNFEPYSHKPPMLFWLINLSWSVFGVSIGAARLVSFLISAAFIFAAGTFAKRLLPQESEISAYAMLALAGMPMFLIYGSVIMFDTLMGVWVILAMTMLWKIGQSVMRPWTYWLAFGALLGLGILAKGPVALVYMLPPALLAPLWCDNAKGRWYAGVGLAVLTGAAIALAWAIPAVILGGPAYGDKIFITQSAGRMINAFDHREPVWFYAAVLIGYLLPLLVWPSLWAAAKTYFHGIKRDTPIRFILCWIIPAFLFFSSISSKQFHYMTPILPGFAVLAALLLSRGDLPKPKSVALPMALMLLPSIVLLVYEALHLPFMNTRLSEASENYGYLHIALSCLLFSWVRRKPRYAAHALSIAAFLLAIMVHVQLGERFLPRYDLQPLAAAIAPYQDRPMAAAPKYDGEYGFILRATKPIDSIGREGVDAWFAQHPAGIVIARYKPENIPPDYTVLYRQDFRTNEVIVIFERKVMVGMK